MSDVIAGVDLHDEPEEVTDILLDLARRGDTDLFGLFRQNAGERIENRRAADQQSAQISRLSGLEGA
ncbi:hypothetical protein OKA06_20525 [Novosphingobium sp. MW5]|nr:hypothetical protein [Novosphingobium sp. MW5]